MVAGCRLLTWQRWQSIGALATSIRSLFDPCGSWQLAQFSRPAACSHRKGPRFSAWQLAHDCRPLPESRGSKNNASPNAAPSRVSALSAGSSGWGNAGGTVNATAAVLRGEVAIDGNWELLVLFQRLLPGPPGSRKPTAEGNGR